jgi:hypothetical protein
VHVEQGREGTLLQTRNKADTDSVDSEVHSAAALVLKGLGSQKGLTSSCAEDSGAGERRERERGEMVRREREEEEMVRRERERERGGRFWRDQTTKRAQEKEEQMRNELQENLERMGNEQERAKTKKREQQVGETQQGSPETRGGRGCAHRFWNVQACIVRKELRGRGFKKV